MPPTCCRNDAVSGDTRDAPRRDRAGWRGWLGLVAGACAMLVVWLVVLPWFAGLPPIRRHIQFMQEKKIDPNAMYYTELETMTEMIDRVRRLRRGEHVPGWSRSEPTRES